MLLLKRIILLSLVTLVFASCVKDEIEIENLDYGIQPEFGIPVAVATIPAQKVIDNIEGDDIIQTGNNGSVSLVFIDSLESFSPDDILNLQNQNFGFGVDLTPLEYAELFNLGSYTIVESEVFSFVTEEGDRLDSVRFHSGIFSLNIETSSTIPIGGIIRVFDVDDTEIYSTGFEDFVEPISISQQESFSNKLMKFINDGEITNGLRIQYEVTFTTDDDNNEVTGPLEINLGLSEYSIATAGGYIAPRTAELEDIDVAVGLFDDSFTGNFTFADPRINMHFENGFGIDLGLQINELYGINANSELFSILSDGIGELPLIDRTESAGSIESSTLTLSNQNLNPSLTEFMAFQPEYISGFFDVRVNPTNQASSFISKSSDLGITLEAVLPIYGAIEDFYLKDTVDVDLGSIVEDANETGEIEKMDLRLIVDNGLPMDAGIQIVFTDSLFQPLDSIFQTSDQLFNSAPINTGVGSESPNYGRATGKTKTLTDISISKDRLNDLEGASQMLIKVFGSTSNNGNQNIRLFSEDEIEIRLSAKLTLNFNE